MIKKSLFIIALIFFATVVIFITVDLFYLPYIQETPTKTISTSSPNISEPISTTTRPLKPKEKPTTPAQQQPTPVKPTIEIPKHKFYQTLIENFNTEYSVIETAKMANRSSPGWWLGSGAIFYSNSGTGKTLQGPLEENNIWRKIYLNTNAIDTDNGYYPQNIFRLVLAKSTWLNFMQELDFKVNNINLSNSPRRDASNGVLFFNRYQDEFNLYYAGIRVDGSAVIKKKINGQYYELSRHQIFGNTVYNKQTNPNVIPLQKWLRFKSEVTTNKDNTVTIKLFIDKDKTGNWVLATQATDDGISYGGSAILDEGYTGIRTDFMDVEFDNYRVTPIF